MPAWLKPLIVAIASIGSARFLAKKNKPKIDRFVMGLVRDIGRHKAKKRRHMNTKGLIVTLMTKDDPNEELRLILNPEEEDESNLETYTEEELYEYGNGLDGNPILIGVLGRVYDVTAGAKFYGQGGDYGNFGGHDVTYALATACKTMDCIETPAVDLTEKELTEAKRWLSFFHLHDKYALVGKMESDYVKVLLDDLIEKDNKTKTTTETLDTDENSATNEPMTTTDESESDPGENDARPNAQSSEL